MATCKDCVHFEACKNIYEIHGDGLSEESYGCDQFSNRARFVELPCRVSGDCFFVNQNGTIQRLTLERVYMFSTSTELFLNDGREIYTTSLNESNIELFPTYEEAEQALKERE